MNRVCVIAHTEACLSKMIKLAQFNKRKLSAEVKEHIIEIKFFLLI